MLKPRKRLTKRQMKEDKLVTYYFKSVDYINQNSKLVTGILLGIIAIVVISYFVVHSRQAAEMNASVELSKAQAELQNGNKETAVAVLRAMINNFSGTENAGRGVFYLANIQYESGEYDEALSLYKKYIDDYGDDVIIASSSYSGAAACYEQKADYVNAAKFYLKGADKYAISFEAPEQLMNAARCYKLADDKTKAKQVYQRLIDDYPDARQKRDAEMFLSALNG
ncbi:tetratricopeptide repeat protein [candidate division KSB1 bacterium]|nr:tetratricopeptide repeat protein [candidate division KSB1 bacterium]